MTRAEITDPDEEFRGTAPKVRHFHLLSFSLMFSPVQKNCPKRRIICLAHDHFRSSRAGPFPELRRQGHMRGGIQRVGLSHPGGRGMLDAAAYACTSQLCTFPSRRRRLASASTQAPPWRPLTPRLTARGRAGQDAQEAQPAAAAGRGVGRLVKPAPQLLRPPPSASGRAGRRAAGLSLARALSCSLAPLPPPPPLGSSVIAADADAAAVHTGGRPATPRPLAA